MALIQTILFYLTSTAFFFGPTFRLNLFSVSIPVFDLLLFLFILSNLTSKPKISNKYIILFIIWNFVSYLFNLKNYGFLYQNFFYLFKLANLCLLLFIPINITKRQKNYFLIVLFTDILFGFIQYFFWPDLTNYKYFGWDPHLNRLTSTFIDPTFVGLIFLLLLIFYFFTNPNIFILLLIYLAISLTYSRSTLLALLISSLYFSLKKNKNIKLYLKTLLLVAITILILPNSIGEGTNLKRTSTIMAKIENYKQAFEVIKQKPLIGHGYNNLVSIKKPTNFYPDHSLSGFDSSLLTITSTSGIIGLTLFLVAFTKYFSNLTIIERTAIISILVHSLFANSLLYSWVIFSYSILFNTKNRK